MDAPNIVGVSPPRANGSPVAIVNDATGEAMTDVIQKGRDVGAEVIAMRDAVAAAAAHAERIASELAEAREIARKLHARPAWKWLLAWWLGR